MKPIVAIARLTFAEGVRMRIVLVCLVVLLLLVLRMPFTLRGDETLAGRLQNFLAYSLGALSFLLSVATVFFSCATLANEFKERSLHLLVTKPVTRYQILLGKWLGINALNVMIVALCGGAIYGFAYWIQSRPEQFSRDRLKVRDVVWTARYAASPTAPANLVEEAQRDVESAIRDGSVPEANRAQELHKRLEDRIRRWRVVRNGEMTTYRFEHLMPPGRDDEVFQIRYKAIGSPIPYTQMLTLGWNFVDPATGADLGPPRFASERSGERHEFLVNASRAIQDGTAVIKVMNPLDEVNRTNVIFDGEDSLQLLYRVSSFETNFAKTLAMIVLRLALLSAVGLFFSIFVSFPVACLCGFAFFVICIGMPWWLESIGANLTVVMPSIDPFGRFGPGVRSVLVPFLKFAFPDFQAYSGTGQLVDGVYLAPELLGVCFVHTLLFGASLLLLPGWLIFRHREVAEVIV